MYELDTIMQFNGQYTIRFFELRKSFLAINTHVAQLTLKELWEILELKKDEYSIFSNFKNRVIEPARLELLEKTGKSFTWKTIKQGKGGKIVGVKFVFDYDAVEDKKIPKTDSKKETQTIESNQSESVINNKENTSDTLRENKQDTLEKLMTFGISDRMIRLMLEEYTVEKIREKLDLLNINENRISGGYLLQALDEDWKDERIELERNYQEKCRRAEQVARRKAELKKLTEKYDVFRREAALSEYQKLTDDKKDKLKNEFISVQMSASNISKNKLDFDNKFFRGFVMMRFQLPTEDDFFKNEGVTLTPEDIIILNEIRL